MTTSNALQKFEDLECWQRARELVNMIYKLTKDGSLAKDFGLKDQMKRASVSVMANIAEGFGCYSNLEFIRFLRISSRSCLEIQSHLYIAKDNDLVRQEDFAKIYDHAQRCANVIRGFIRYLRSEKVL